MKKLLFFILISLFIASATQVAVYSYATNTTIDTAIVLPETYLEYCELNSPVDVWTDGTFFAIAEQEKIIVFDGENFKHFDFSGFSITKVEKKGNYLLFLNASQIYTIDLTATSPLATPSGIIAATSFCIKGNLLATNTSSDVNIYNIINSTTAFEVSTPTTKAFNSSIGTATAMALSDEGALYYEFAGKIKCFDGLNEREIANSVPDVRYSTFGSGYLYLTATNGIYRVSVSSGAMTTLATTTADNVRLGKLVEPQGLIYTSNGLYICDSTLNAIQLFDLTSCTFTDFYITSEHTADNRLSKNANCVFGSNDYLYTLGEESIKVTSPSSLNSIERSIPLDDFRGAKLFAKIDSLYLLSATTNLQLAKESDGKLSRVDILDASVFNNVSSICAYEKDFFILNNEIIEGAPHAVLYKLSSETYLITKLGSIAGYGQQLASDVFGDIYIEIANGINYSVYITDTTFSTPQKRFDYAEKLLSFSADYEGTIISLLSSNRLLRTDKNGVSTVSTVNVSQNLPSVSAVSLALMPATDNLYLLYPGFILKADSTNLEISTPSKISVPTNFSLDYTTSLQVVTVKKSSKLFNVSLENTKPTDKYFAYVDYSLSDDATHEYLLLHTTDRYSIIADENTTAIIRTADSLLVSRAFTSISEIKYPINNCSLFSYPILNNYFITASAPANSTISISGEFIFNNVSFSIATYDNKQGYIATKLLKETIAEQMQAVDYTIKTVGKTGAVIYSDKELTTEFSTLEAYGKIKILKAEDLSTETAKAILLDDGTIGYIKSVDIVSRGSYILKNILVISLLALSLFISSFYLIRRALHSRKLV